MSTRAILNHTEKCIKRITENCHLSNNSIKRIKGGTQKCKHVQNGKDQLEVFLQEDSKNVVIIQTHGDGLAANECPLTKYEIDKDKYDDDTGIADLKVITGKKGSGRFDGQKVFLLSVKGKVFIMDQDHTFYEIKNSSDKSYRNVEDIKGDVDGIRLIGPGFPKDGFLLTMDGIEKRFKQGKVDKLSFQRYKTDRDLWRDESVTDHGRPVNTGR